MLESTNPAISKHASRNKISVGHVYITYQTNIINVLLEFLVADQKVPCWSTVHRQWEALKKRSITFDNVRKRGA